MEASPRADTQFGAKPPVIVENGAGRFVILCDHASNALPSEYGTLGLTPEQRDAHIAWDPGALGVSRDLARRLDAPLVYSTVSRLVIDCNRALDATDLIAERSEMTAIPGNAALSDAERRRRIAFFYEPYHAAVDSLVAGHVAAGRETSLVAVHSFTPVYRGKSRPWEIGILFDRDRRLADLLIESLKASGVKVGVNEPYSPADGVYHTLTRHGGARGLASVMIEIRNDLIRSAGAEGEWAARIAGPLAAFAPSVRAA